MYQQNQPGSLTVYIVQKLENRILPAIPPVISDIKHKSYSILLQCTEF